ncbi:hypothetical protein E2C01_052294 [Portunus trituberculatus]|uniref:Uncharacterized protein n=1 Tax=Portunus trituberculatus TaxID=210409 RepID=A0A5B7GML8_PORTR|nr:hypothetical protein [Portunus trituberculatus]
MIDLLAAVLNRLQSSVTACLQELLCKELSDEKPSDLLSRMKKLLDDKYDSFDKKLFCHLYVPALGLLDASDNTLVPLQSEGVFGESSAGATPHVKTFASQDLDSCSHIFLRVNGVRRPLQQPYHCSFKVIHQIQKTFILNVNGSSQTVAVDRMKPAYLLQDVPDQAAANATSAVCSAATQLGLCNRKVSFLLPCH